MSGIEPLPVQELLAPPATNTDIFLYWQEKRRVEDDRAVLIIWVASLEETVSRTGTQKTAGCIACVFRSSGLLPACRVASITASRPLRKESYL